MKYIKLSTIFTMYIILLSTSLQSTQPMQNSSWWERSKNYAASWIPQFVQQKAKTLRHAFLKQVYPVSYKYCFLQTMLLVPKIISIKSENPNQDITENVNYLLTYAFNLAGPFDVELIIHDVLSPFEKEITDKLSHSEEKNIALFQKRLSILNELKTEIDKALPDFIKNKSTQNPS